MKTNLATGFVRLWLKHLADCVKKGFDRLIVSIKPLLQLRKLHSELLIAGEHLSQMNKCANDADARLHRDIAIENTGKHDGTVFGKNPRELASATMRT